MMSKLERLRSVYGGRLRLQGSRQWRDQWHGMRFSGSPEGRRGLSGLDRAGR